MNDDESVPKPVDPNAETEPPPPPPPKRNIGFARLDDDARKAMARRGGLALQRSGKAHRLTPEERQRGAVAGVRTRTRPEGGV
jgi:hypothetical protein